VAWALSVQLKSNEDLSRRWTRAFASVLAACRRDADLTQEQVAAAMGWTRNTVTKIEGALRAVTLPELMALCRLYKVSAKSVLVRAEAWVG
jgi:transcriptional regulator with XRE-family HTH domain